jgi:iron complex transport system substrate-binding protein
MTTSPAGHPTCPWGQPRRILALLALALACAPAPAPDTTGPARRILSQTVLSDEILWSLGPAARSRVVGLSTMADDPRYSRAAGQWPLEVPRLAVTSEGLLAQRPDLVVIASFSAPEIKAMLRAQSVRLLEFDSFTGFADYRRQLRQLAAVTEADAAADTIIADLDRRLALLATRRPTPAPTAIAWSDGYAAAGGTTFADVAAAAGFINLPERSGLSGHVPIAMELLLAWDPEVIVISCHATDASDPACPAAEARFAEGPGITATRAYRDDRIVALPARDIGGTGEGMILSAELLQARLLARTAP